MLEIFFYLKYDSVYFYDRKSEEISLYNEEIESLGDESIGSVVEYSDVDEDRVYI